MSYPLFQVDSFTTELFRGNPAAVCLLDEMPADGWLQNVAAEMNLSETAFVLPRGGDYQLRWFTPVAEVELCGHATLAAAHILWETGRASEQAPIRFDTLSGQLSASKLKETIALNFPASPLSECLPPTELQQALDVQPMYCGKTQFDYLIQVADEETVRTCRPDFQLLRRFGARGVILTARASGADYDFVSRFFAPGVGIDEDPVTGSAHCALAPFWAGIIGRQALVGYQASARGGIVHCQLTGDRIELGGSAVTVFRGELVG